jgi:hypothetical protein
MQKRKREKTTSLEGQQEREIYEYYNFVRIPKYTKRRAKNF